MIAQGGNGARSPLPPAVALPVVFLGAAVPVVAMALLVTPLANMVVRQGTGTRPHSETDPGFLIIGPLAPAACAALALVTAWLGGQLVKGDDPHAHLRTRWLQA